MVKTREAGAAANRAIYLAIGVNTDGIKEVLASPAWAEWVR